MLWVSDNHLPVSVQTTQPYAPSGYWQGVPPECLTDVSTHAGQKARLSREPDIGAVLVLEVPSPPVGCLH